MPPKVDMTCFEKAWQLQSAHYYYLVAFHEKYIGSFFFLVQWHP